jgi:hypothetical protein
MVTDCGKFRVPFTLKSRGESLLVKGLGKGFPINCSHITLISLDIFVPTGYNVPT